MEGWVAVTHHGWFDFLARKRIWEEVRPAGGADQPDADCLDWHNTHVFFS